jgi:hypothetical protein
MRAHRNGDAPRYYLRAFQIVGRDGLTHLGYGSRTAAHVFDSRSKAEDIVRRLRRRAAIGAYNYLVEEVVEQAGAYPG